MYSGKRAISLSTASEGKVDGACREARRIDVMVAQCPITGGTAYMPDRN